MRSEAEPVHLHHSAEEAAHGKPGQVGGILLARPEQELSDPRHQSRGASQHLLLCATRPGRPAGCLRARQGVTRYLVLGGRG